MWSATISGEWLSCKSEGGDVTRSRRVAIGLVLAAAVASVSVGAGVGSATGKAPPTTTTPIQHLVVIFQENVSFDHYFGTYPNAMNPAGEPQFQASAHTPSVNGLGNALLNNNPNVANPERLDRSQAV